MEERREGEKKTNGCGGIVQTERDRKSTMPLCYGIVCHDSVERYSRVFL